MGSGDIENASTYTNVKRLSDELSWPFIGLYKIFVYFEAVVHETSFLPPPTCIAHRGAILVHDCWTVYDSPSDFPFVCYTPHTIGNYNIV